MQHMRCRTVIIDVRWGLRFPQGPMCDPSTWVNPMGVKHLEHIHKTHGHRWCARGTSVRPWPDVRPKHMDECHGGDVSSRYLRMYNLIHVISVIRMVQYCRAVTNYPVATIALWLLVVSHPAFLVTQKANSHRLYSLLTFFRIYPLVHRWGPTFSEARANIFSLARSAPSLQAPASRPLFFFGRDPMSGISGNFLHSASTTARCTEDGRWWYRPRLR